MHDPRHVQVVDSRNAMLETVRIFSSAPHNEGDAHRIRRQMQESGTPLRQDPMAEFSECQCPQRCVVFTDRLFANGTS